MASEDCAGTLALGAMETCEDQEEKAVKESAENPLYGDIDSQEIIGKALMAAEIDTDHSVDHLTNTATGIELSPPSTQLGDDLGAAPTSVASKDHLYGITLNSSSSPTTNASANILPAPLSPLEVLSLEISAVCSSGLYADVTLIGSGSRGGVAAHGMVLAAVSPMIRRVMLESVRAMEEAVTTVMFPDVDEGRLEACLADMYRVMAKVINNLLLKGFGLFVLILYLLFRSKVK